MKRIIAIALLSIFVLSLVSCGSNTDSGQPSTGEEFVVQRKKNSKWKDVKYITKEEVGWLAMARIIPKGEKSTFDVDWEGLYGKLSAGEYRIGKEFMNFRGTGDFDEQVIYAEFTIKE